MSPPRDDVDGLAFDREEAWVAHAALLAACERFADTETDTVAALEADTAPVDAVENPPHRRPLRRIERGEPLGDEGTACSGRRSSTTSVTRRSATVRPVEPCFAVPRPRSSRPRTASVSTGAS